LRNWRAILSATSLASEPPVEKNALWMVFGARLISFSASRTADTVPCLPDTCSTSCSCRVTASMIRGWQWPALLTKYPAVRSRYSLPWTSVTVQPRAFAMITGSPAGCAQGRITYFSSAASIALASGICSPMRAPWRQWFPRYRTSQIQVKFHA